MRIESLTELDLFLVGLLFAVEYHLFHLSETAPAPFGSRKGTATQSSCSRGSKIPQSTCSYSIDRSDVVVVAKFIVVVKSVVVVAKSVVVVVVVVAKLIVVVTKFVVAKSVVVVAAKSVVVFANFVDRDIPVQVAAG